MRGVSMFRISKDFEFSYSHALDHLPEGHKCKRNHGHNGIIRVTLAADTLSPDGFVMDYAELEPLKGFIDQELDHRNLNEVLVDAGVIPMASAELLAKYIYEICKNIYGWPVVEVAWSETPKTWATYNGAASV
jgi:6-pyruvoyltetrahydropterin/6-carboxytetrahydropterin synthase